MAGFKFVILLPQVPRVLRLQAFATTLGQSIPSCALLCVLGCKAPREKFSITTGFNIDHWNNVKYCLLPYSESW